MFYFRNMNNIESLRKKLDNWDDLSMEGLRKRNLIQTRIYELKRQEELKKITGRRLGADDGSVGDII